ncbi:OsmC family protein [Rubripirellula reticaptiva]|uniref:OsmC-like protein n=1 Tax=Rubripirellula reticaptiva TaxID=2528013 RepID=A0A5C6EH72_9BACT|nr:OsmC family protein [Rubripirellula reticaptiva]TWU46589.1 OsmC-like protein [Rubripirellula reticaptiva]
MIVATISWSNAADDFAKQSYSRRHTWSFDGGLTIAASSSPDIVPVPMSDASAVDPEEAFVASLSSCHMLWFLSIAAKAGFVVEEYIDEAAGEMRENDAGKSFIAVVTLRPVVKWGGDREPESAELRRLHDQAHEECFIANSVKTQIRIEIE